MNSIQKFLQYLRDVKAEMIKVTWPTRDELVGATTLVVVLSLVVAAIVKVFDMGLSKLVGFLLNL
jgi:preprotein translocase subunit SecE